MGRESIDRSLPPKQQVAPYPDVLLPCYNLPNMSFSSKLFLFIIIALPLAILIYTQQDNIKAFLDQVLIGEQTYIETPTSNEPLKSTATIKTVAFNECDIIITDSESNSSKVGALNNPCSDNPKFIISDSRKYLAFEDKTDTNKLEIRIYSIEHGAINSLAVLGTSSVLDMEFISEDKMVILYGNPSSKDEQYISSFNIPALYQNYRNNVDKYGNLWAAGKYEKRLPITPIEGDYFDIVEMGKKVSIFGGEQQRPILRSEFDIKDL